LFGWANAGVFENTAPDFTTYYLSGNSGFSLPRMASR
jgi:hypothetical protein